MMSSPKTDAPKRVLLVEDYEDSRFSLSKLLEIEGYEVLEAVDGAQAVDVAINHRPDLILMDVTLPVLDGLSAAERIRQHEALTAVPIIALSALDLADFQGRAKAAGCTDILTKPVDFSALMGMLSKYLPA
ncbi:MAG TPA: response regulator [Blastocatellia bacterium]|nr:response regulator [Blastocatellia bacterium]